MNEYVINGTKLNDNTRISFVSNPKRPNSMAHARYESYQDSTTFGEYLELNEGKYSMADARHDLNKGFLIIDDENIDEDVDENVDEDVNEDENDNDVFDNEKDLDENF